MHLIPYQLASRSQLQFTRYRQWPRVLEGHAELRLGDICLVTFELPSVASPSLALTTQVLLAAKDGP